MSCIHLKPHFRENKDIILPLYILGRSHSHSHIQIIVIFIVSQRLVVKLASKPIFYYIDQNLLLDTNIGSNNMKDMNNDYLMFFCSKEYQCNKYNVYTSNTPYQYKV